MIKESRQQERGNNYKSIHTNNDVSKYMKQKKIHEAKTDRNENRNR